MAEGAWAKRYGDSSIADRFPPVDAISKEGIELVVEPYVSAPTGSGQSIDTSWAFVRPVPFELIEEENDPSQAA